MLARWPYGGVAHMGSYFGPQRWGQVNEVNWSEVKWGELKWSELKWSEVRWSEVKWGEVKWSELKWSEVKWGEGKWIELNWIELNWIELNEWMIEWMIEWKNDMTWWTRWCMNHPKQDFASRWNLQLTLCSMKLPDLWPHILPYQGPMFLKSLRLGTTKNLCQGR